MIYEFMRPGDAKPFIFLNNPPDDMLEEIMSTFPGLVVTKRHSCEFCYCPDCYGECETGLPLRRPRRGRL